MRIAVIIVNYGTADLAISAVESVIVRQHGGHDVDVHLVDNASPGNDTQRFLAIHAEQGWGEQVKLWLEADNHGFGCGNNVVLKALAAGASPPDYVFLLNPDARLENETIDILVRYFEKDPDIGCVGAGISQADGTPATAAFRFPSAVGEFAQAVSFGPLDRLCAASRIALPPMSRAGPVDWVSGAAVMFRMQALIDVDFFDPGFFLYYEEVDLMRRMTERGWSIHSEPDAHVSHIAGAATNVRDGAPERKRTPAYLYRSWRRYFYKSHGRLYALWAALGVTVGNALGACLSLLRGRKLHLPLNFFQDQWNYVVAPLVGLTRNSNVQVESSNSGRTSTAGTKGRD